MGVNVVTEGKIAPKGFQTKSYCVWYACQLVAGYNSLPRPKVQRNLLLHCWAKVWTRELCSNGFNWSRASVVNPGGSVPAWLLLLEWGRTPPTFTTFASNRSSTRMKVQLDEKLKWKNICLALLLFPLSVFILAFISFCRHRGEKNHHVFIGPIGFFLWLPG